MTDDNPQQIFLLNEKTYYIHPSRLVFMLSSSIRIPKTVPIPTNEEMLIVINLHKADSRIHT